ncbi:MAG: hypothetical protein ACRDKE_12105 [Solirubrobacterales bacterium]
MALRLHIQRRLRGGRGSVLLLCPQALDSIVFGNPVLGSGQVQKGNRPSGLVGQPTNRMENLVNHSRIRSTVLVLSAITCVLALGSTASAKSISKDTQAVFYKGNSGWVSCITFAEDQFGPAHIVCTAPSITGTAECGGSISLDLARTGEAAHGELCGGGFPIKRFKRGQHFTWHGIRCTGIKKGVRCKNKSGHGLRVTVTSATTF